MSLLSGTEQVGKKRNEETGSARQNWRFSVLKCVDLFVVAHNWRRSTDATGGASQINACCSADSHRRPGAAERTCFDSETPAVRSLWCRSGFFAITCVPAYLAPRSRISCSRWAAQRASLCARLKAVRSRRLGVERAEAWWLQVRQRSTDATLRHSA